MKNSHLNSFYSFSNKDVGHTFILGNTRSGKSIINVEPTEEQLIEQKRIENEYQEKELKKLNAIKKAYWQCIFDDEDNSELHVIKNCLFVNTDLFDDIEPTLDQIQKTFMLFDEYIIGQCISFGVTDTEVSKEINDFIKNNIELISKELEK